MENDAFLKYWGMLMQIRFSFIAGRNVVMALPFRILNFLFFFLLIKFK